MKDALRSSFAELAQTDAFIRRHIGPAEADQSQMLRTSASRRSTRSIDKVVPASIRSKQPLALGEAMSEAQVLDDAAPDRHQEQGVQVAHRPGLFRLPHADGHPAQSAGKPGVVHGLHALPARDFAGPPGSPAQLPDHGQRSDGHGDRQRVAARRGHGRGRGHDAVSRVWRRTRARCSSSRPTAIRRRSTCCARAPSRSASRWWSAMSARPSSRHDCFGVLLQYPGTSGEVRDPASVIKAAHDAGGLVAVAADLLALTLLKPPGELGADVVVGSTQRFGVPMGFGGPHAAYFATRDLYKRDMPGPPRRRLRRCPGRQGLSTCAADARTAHPPREGVEQHLHRAGAARHDRSDVCVVPRTGRPDGHRQARAPPDRHVGRRVAAPWHQGRDGGVLRHACRRNAKCRCAQSRAARASINLREIDAAACRHLA